METDIKNYEDALILSCLLLSAANAADKNGTHSFDEWYSILINLAKNDDYYDKVSFNFRQFYNLSNDKALSFQDIQNLKGKIIYHKKLDKNFVVWGTIENIYKQQFIQIGPTPISFIAYEEDCFYL